MAGAARAALNSMSQGLVDAIWRGWRAPRDEMARLLEHGLSEARAAAILMLACVLALVASLPNAVRQARLLDIDDPVAGAVAAHLFGYLFLAPLLFYAIAALMHLACRVFGGSGSYLAARTAVFWSALLGAPVAITLSLAGIAGEVAGGAILPWLSYLGYAGLAFWLWLLASNLAEAEGFAATRRVVAVLVAAFLGVSGLAAVLLGAARLPG
jgi:hypothetical protein